MWYKSKIKYDALVEGDPKMQTETYLFEAVSFGEVEKNCYETLKKRVKAPDVDAIAKAQFTEVLFHAMQPEDAFYQVKVQSIDYDGKKTRWVYLVPAISYQQAGERVQNHLRDTLLPWEITHVDKSDIMAVWMPHNEIWQGDWHNRMDRYYDEGKYEAGHNQLDLVFDKKPADDFKNMANSLGATITISDAQGRGKKTFRPEAVEN